MIATERGRLHYGWVVVAVTGLALLVSAGVRSAPGILVHPLTKEFGWSTGSISLAISVGILLYGLTGPAVGRLLERFGARRLLAVGLLLVAASTALGAAAPSLGAATAER